jgi:ADP-Ribosyltransferase in polyvalent proteins
VTNVEAYHGTSGDFTKFDQSKARLFRDFYGGGVAYFTSNRDVAKSYARAATKTYKTDAMYVYRCMLSMKKTFDVDHVFTGPELTALVDRKTSEDFARGAGLLRVGVDRYAVLADLEAGRMKLTGEQVFRGLSKGMVLTDKAREKLIEHGYDSLRYNGGVNMGASSVVHAKHDVWIMYDASHIKILGKTRLVKKA